jgi:small-conductance mechanosensitive channel/CRP-like cAMP-binding protein
VNRKQKSLIPGALVTASAFVIFHFARRAGTPGAPIVFYVSGIVGWLALAWLAGRLIDLAVQRALRTNRSQAPRLFYELIHAALYAIAVIAILVLVFDKEATGLIATSSVLIAVIGFGLRNIIGDLFSGIALNFDLPYHLGDWVEPAPGVLGQVTEITWRSTRLVTRDGTVVIVPNGVIANNRVVNYSEPKSTFRVNLRLWLDPRLPVTRVKKTLLMGGLVAQRRYPDLRPDVLAQDCGESGILYVVRFWVPDAGEENACRDQVVTAIAQTMERHGIALQAPRRDITVIQPDEVTLPTLAPKTREELVDDSDFFQIFTPEEREVIAHKLIEHRFKNGDTVFERNAPGGTLFFVADGAVEVRVPATGENPAFVLDRMVPGDMFGEISLLTGEPRSAMAAAATDDVLLYELTKDAIEPYLWSRPDIFDRLAALMVERRKQNRIRLDAAADASDCVLGKADLASRIKQFFAFHQKSG